MSIPQLSQLTPVPLREAWPHEAGSFTPWLAQCENLRLLSDAIGMQLECEAQEKAVGSFSADIICRDLSTDHLVLIENQIERTNHSHLGQILTYAAGLKVHTIIWVAAEFREEHRAALDWLNEMTTEDINFIGVEVHLWRIGESIPAPTFNIISKPNNWSREMRETAREAGELTEGKALQREFWDAFTMYLRNNNFTGNTPKPLPQNWMNFRIGRSGIRLAVVASTYNNSLQTYDTGELRVELVLGSVSASALLPYVEKQRDQIDAALAPDVAQWYAKEGVRMKRIFVTRPADITDRSDWANQHEWLYRRLLKFGDVFRPIVAELPR